MWRAPSTGARTSRTCSGLFLLRCWRSSSSRWADSPRTTCAPQPREAGLEVADEPESQEVCFATDGYQDFLEGRGVEPAEGDLVDADGVVVGRHQGHWRYTIGQRRGIGVSAARPLYVLERKAAANEVVIGGRDELDVRSVRVRDVVDRALGEGNGLEVQLRYRSAPVAVAALERRGDELVVTLGEPFAGLAPGQAAVFYREDVVVGGGRIACAPPEDRGS